MSSNNANKSWFTRPRGNSAAALRLFCFPYAGGGATLFRTWPDGLPPFVEVYAAQLPGRGPRLSEPSFTHLTPMVEAIAEAIRPHLDKPYAFFGHSMGAMISFDLARLLRRERARPPVHLFVSGRRAPQSPENSRRTYDLPEPEFIEELRRLNGTPREVLEHPELMQLMTPLLRADFSVCQTYEYTPEPPLSCPITVFGGVEDETGREQLEAWREQTTSTFTLNMFPGGHFFIHEAQPQVLQIIGHQLRQRAGAFG
jgi:medium-chain acyl-[acyl-carrier-protein] hydrolase